MRMTAPQATTSAQATACADITWHFLSAPPQPGEMPDAEINVLLAYGDEEVTEGWADGVDEEGRPIWRDYSAWPMKGVYAWADLPAAPQRPGPANRGG
jgi:hypothetical protein